MAGPDSGAGGVGIGTVVKVGGFAARVIGRTLFGANPKERGFYIKQYDAAGNTIGRTRVGVREYNRAVAGGYRPGAQIGTVTPIRPPGSTPAPPPSPDVPPAAPGGLRGEAVRQGAVLAAWLIGQMGVDALRKSAQKKKEKEKAAKKAAAAAKKKAEAEAKKQAAEAARRNEALYRATYGRRPPTAGRGPITGPLSGNRMYDLRRNPAAPKLPGRTAIDVYVHQTPTPSARPEAAQDIRLDPFYSQVVNAEKNYPLAKPVLDYGRAPRLRPQPKSATRRARSTAKGALAKAKGAYAKYLETGAFAATLFTAFKPKTRPKNRPVKSSSSDPLTGNQPGLLQFPQAALAPAYAYAYDRKGKCSCPKPKKKKRGPRKARSVCYKGSFTERAFGTSKRKREQIPCRA